MPLAMSHATIDFLSPEALAALDVEIRRDRQLSRDPATPRAASRIIRAHEASMNEEGRPPRRNRLISNA